MLQDTQDNAAGADFHGEDELVSGIAGKQLEQYSKALQPRPKGTPTAEDMGVPPVYDDNIPEWLRQLCSQIRADQLAGPLEFQQNIYGWDNDNGSRFELGVPDRERLSKMIREAGKRHEPEVQMRIEWQIQEFIEGIMDSQDHYRINAILIEAFGDDAENHSLGLFFDGKYYLSVYNLKRKQPEGN